MSSKITVKPHSGVGAIGLISIIVGLLMIVVGGVAWGLVATQLAAENITVASDSKFLPNKNVNDPFSAFAQANAINEHAQAMSGGKTYAELDSDDPMREVVMNASFLRASLFTSVVAFGVSAFVGLVGLLAIISGWALRRTAGGPPLVIETTDSGPVEFENATGAKLIRDAEKVEPAPAKETVVAPLAPVVPVAATEPEPATPKLSAFPTVTPAPQDLAVTPTPQTEPSPRDRTATAQESQAMPVAQESVTESLIDKNQPSDRAQAQKAHLTGTGSIPIVAVPPAGPLTSPAAPGTEPEAPQTQPPASGVNGWSSPADRLPKQDG